MTSAFTVPEHVPENLVRDFDHIADPEFLADPFTSLLSLRGDDRAFFSPHSEGFWVLTRGADIREAYQRPDLFSNNPGGLPAKPTEYPLIPEELDPPEHTKYRRAIAGMFSPREVAEMEDDIRDIARQLLETAKPLGSGDFCQLYAVPLPTQFFVNRLGLPVEETKQFVSWNNDMMRHTDDPIADRAASMKAYQQVNERLTALVADRKAQPREDWVSRLLETRIDGEPMSDSDVLAVTFLLFMAGLETVATAMTWSFNFLARNDEYRHQLAEDSSYSETAAEELLRYFSFTNDARTVTKDIDFAGVHMRKGDRVLLCNSLVSRDPEENERPDEVDFDRTVSRNAVFGMGAHRCLGSHLARLELKIALEEWHAAIPEYHVTPGTDLRIHGAGIMGIEKLPLSWP
ncbi:cytochrome P450 [Nocardia kruczakiae]|uniref:Cytochrome P450 n=1 Tax=Nocardia kruczakiae TaxID=261477 RepID=A0ABU1X9T9_9NOCA|nr:cytochrome P450 [Nocardia kruczakiae]MDR7167305.1 cytochrome P450 [Nocardia kruczakiae]